MTPELRIGIGIALIVHVGFFFGFSVNTIPQYEVIVAPSSLEVSLVAPAPPKRIQPKPILKDEVKKAEPQRVPKIQKQKPLLEKVVPVEKKTEPLKREPEKIERPKPIPVEPTVSNAMRGAISEAKPLMAENQPPRYPRVARVRGYEGTAVLRVFVDVKGKPSLVELKRSSGNKSLDNAALKAIKRWRFVPAQRFGVRVASQVEIPVVFRLEQNL